MTAPDDRHLTRPYQDRTLGPEQRAGDLLDRLTLADKAGLLFHDIAAMLPGGRLMGSDNAFGRPGTERAIRDLRMNHFNLAGSVQDVRDLVSWHNRLQDVASTTGPGIPVTVSSDPRHAFSTNPGTEATAGAFSQWPQPLGLAALRDPGLVARFADVARQEYVAGGIRVALHPQVDLATEPRWARIGMTFGEDADLTCALVTAYVGGLQGARIGPTSVSTVTKHFPGGGPQLDGEDPHFAHGREQVYPGDRRSHHLLPFRAAIAAGTAQMMPYYGMPVGTDWEEVGFAFSHGVVTTLLREELGFDGIVLTDWGLIGDSTILGQPMPARAWGAEHLTEVERVARILLAGCDQFGGESRPELVVEAVRSGLVTEERVDRSVHRVLREKFALGLFDDPYVDAEQAVATIGRADFVAEGEAAQRAAVVRLTAAGAGPARLPLRDGLAVYVENVDAEQASRLGLVVDDPSLADLAVIRIAAPYEPREGGFEAFFHAGSLAYADAERDRIVELCAKVPTIVVLFLDRPAVVPEIAEAAAALVVEFGARDDAVVDVLLGLAAARGRLPFDLPSSMARVEQSRSDVPFDTELPLFRFGDGILDGPTRGS